LTPALAGHYGLLLIVRDQRADGPQPICDSAEAPAHLQVFVIGLLGDEPIASISTVSSAASPPSSSDRTTGNQSAE
jgi:hypothetical protein